MELLQNETETYRVQHALWEICHVYAGCAIGLKAWAVGDSVPTGEITVMRRTLATISEDGLLVATINDLEHCQANVSKMYHLTQESDAIDFVAFIDSLKAGTLVFGASGGDISGYEYLMQPALKTLGLTLYGLNGQSSITFYAKKDFPEFGFQRSVPATMGPNILYKDFTEGEKTL